MIGTYEMSLQDYVRIFWKRKWIVFLSTFTVLIVAVVYTNFLTPRYRAAGQAEVKFKEDLANVLADLFYQGRELSEARQNITSNEVLIQAAESLGLVDPGAADPHAEQLRAAMNLKEGLAVTELPNTTIFEISYTGENPEDCANRVNAILRAFAQIYEAQSKEGKQQALNFITGEIERIQGELAEKEAKLTHLTGSELRSQSTALAEAAAKARADLEEVNQGLREASEERASLEEAIRSGEGESAERYARNHPDVRALRQDIVAQQMTLQEKLRNYTPEHPEVRRAQAEIRGLYIRLSETIRRVLDERLEGLQAQEEAFGQRARRLQEVIRSADGRIDLLPVDEVEKAKIERDIRALERVHSFFVEEFEKKRMEERLELGSEIRILVYANPPAKPFYPSRSTNMVLGLSIGLLLGVALAFIVESLDTSIATIEDVERYTGIPVLGVIPHIAGEEGEEEAPMVRALDPEHAYLSEAKERLAEVMKKAETGGRPGRYLPQLITYLDPKDPSAEAFRTLRTNLQFRGFANGSKTLCITSSGPQEGKTTTLANLAVVMAQSGLRTLAVSSNLRRPAIHKFFGLAKKPGLVDTLIGARKWEEIVQQTGIDKLQILASGPIPPNPAELLASEEMTRFIAEVREAYDAVLFDCPPVLPVTDAAILSSKTEGLLLVYYIGRAAREALQRAKVQLENVRAHILGIALNQVHPEGKLGYSYYYYHYHYYGEPTEYGRKKRS